MHLSSTTSSREAKLRSLGARRRSQDTSCLIFSSCALNSILAPRMTSSDLLVQRHWLPFYGLLEACTRHMSCDCRREMAKFSREICSFYATLSSQHAPNAWRLTPKFHLLLHLVEVQIPQWGSPRFFWCYADDDLIGQVIDVASSCHPSTMAAVALYKCSLMQSLS